MGTWGTGLFDNDGAQDRVSDLVPRIEKARTAEDLAARVGLTLWLAPGVLGAMIDEGELADEVARFDLATLSAPIRARLRTLAKGSAEDLPAGTRSEDLGSSLGTGADGPREALLLEMPIAKRMMHELEDRCATLLDAVEVAAFDESFEEFAPLGLLAVLGARVERGRVAGWRQAFDRCDALTTDERAHWDEAVERVRPLFNQVADSEE